MLVVDPGFLTTLQDSGRAGWQRFGVPAGGAMDRFALMAANALVGAPTDAAGLECALGGCALLAEEDTLVAAAGVGVTLTVGGRALPLWMAAYARPGEQIVLAPDPAAPLAAGWSYLAFAGGIAAPLVMGSRSTYLRGGFGGLHGRALQPGDRLPLGPAPAVASLMARAGSSLPARCRPAYAAQAVIAAVAGPQETAFTGQALDTFFSSEYAVTPASDRMGYRLSGPALEHASPAQADLLSEGTALGSVQVPAAGQPLVLLADRQATGGYPKIATVASMDLPLLVQSRPGEGRVRFRRVSVAEAQAGWRALAAGLRTLAG